MDLQRKLAILADAAKYEASCASSGTETRDSRDGKGMGSTDANILNPARLKIRGWRSKSCKPRCRGNTRRNPPETSLIDPLI